MPRIPGRAAGFALLVTALCGLGAASAVWAQSWKPDKPVEILVGTSHGGPQDRMGRVLQKALQDNRWIDAPIIVVNKPGGGGTVGFAYLNQHAGDGRHVLVNGVSLFSNHLMGKSTYAYTDFTPVAVMGVEYVTVAVRADSPIRSGKELVERLRKDPGSVSVVIGTGAGTATHLAFSIAMKTAGVDVRKLKTVAFNSGAEGITAVLGGHVEALSMPPSIVLPQMQAGKLRMLAIGAPRRASGDLANVPTWKEQGVDSAFEQWRGLAGPKGMSRAQTAFWDEALAKVVKTDAVPGFRPPTP